jgi:hypothetical protein
VQYFTFFTFFKLRSTTEQMSALVNYGLGYILGDFFSQKHPDTLAHEKFYFVPNNFRAMEFRLLLKY